MMKNNSNIAVKFEKVNFSYDRKVQVLRNTSFSIYENEYVCILGHNGCGKSTVSKILTGLLKPQSGDLILFGEKITSLNLRHLRNNVGIVFQNPDNQFIGLTAEDDIAFGLENRKVDPKKMKQIITQVAKVVKVDDLLSRESHLLSGGQKQRVAIASALAMNPNIIIFDESTSMLDPKAKQHLKELMVILKKYYGKTVISITHDMEEVINADRVIVMEKGSVVKTGKPSEVFTDREFLIKLKLDLPFTLLLSMALHDQNNKINPTLSYNELVDNIISVDKKWS